MPFKMNHTLAFGLVATLGLTLAGCSSLPSGAHKASIKPATKASLSAPSKVTTNPDGKVTLNLSVTTAKQAVTLTDGKQLINIPAKSTKPVNWQTQVTPKKDTHYTLKLVMKGAPFKGKALAKKTITIKPSKKYKSNYQRKQTAVFHRYVTTFYKGLATLSYPNSKSVTVKLTDKNMKGAIANVQQGYANREQYNSFKTQQLKLSKQIKKTLGKGYTITLVNPANPKAVLYQVHDGEVKADAL